MSTLNNKTHDMIMLVSNIFNSLYSIQNLELERSSFKRRQQMRNRLARKLGFIYLYELPEITSYWILPEAKKRGL